MRPPATIDGARVLAWAWSGERPFGVLPDTEGNVVAEVYGFALARYADSAVVYRFSCDRRWSCVQDADYPSLAEAKAGIPEQYDRARVSWQELA